MADGFTIPGLYSVQPIRTGDTFTISCVYALDPNPDRRWWQFWKPRFVRSEKPVLQTFYVAGTF